MPPSTCFTNSSIPGSVMAAEAVEAARAIARAEARARRRSIVAALLLWVPIAWLAAAVFADWLPLPAPDDQDLVDILAPPGAHHLLGADSLGRDILSRTIFALRVSLMAGIGSVAIGLVGGGFIGMVAGYFRGR